MSKQSVGSTPAWIMAAATVSAAIIAGAFTLLDESSERSARLDRGGPRSTTEAFNTSTSVPLQEGEPEHGLETEGFLQSTIVPSVADVDSFRQVLEGYIKELEEIDDRWPDSSSRIEPLAIRVTSVLEEMRPGSASEIRQSLNSVESASVARAIRNEVDIMLDLIAAGRLTTATEDEND